MQQCLQERVSEKSENAKPIVGKDLLLWRLKRLFWGRNSITTAILTYGVLWIGLTYGFYLLSNELHIYPSEDDKSWRTACFAFVIYGIPSLLSAHITARLSPKWATFAVGLFSGGFIGYIAKEIIQGIKNGDNASNIALVVLLLSNFLGFLLARKIRNKHFGIRKKKSA
jgi:hypothetical protein